MIDPTDLPLPACAYVRVSTKRQAEHEISLIEQQAGIARAAADQGYKIVETYIEAGKSGMTDRHPAFQRMIAEACAQPNAMMPCSCSTSLGFSGMTMNARAIAESWRRPASN